MKSKQNSKIYLFWIKTKCKSEDCFIVAFTKEIACECHEYGEGFNKGDASAELICEIPSELEKKYRSKNDKNRDGYWPSLELLKDLGFELLEPEPTYKFRRCGRLFHFGGSLLKIAKEKLVGVLGVYIVNIRRTNKSKIGITNNISRRLKEFKTANPDTIDLFYFLSTKLPRLVEWRIHEILSEKKVEGEWFDIEKLEDIHSAIAEVSKEYAIEIYNIKKYIGI